MSSTAPRPAARAKPPEAPPSPELPAFSVPVFRAAWLASLCSNFGGLVQAVGASWLMTQLSGSAQLAALLALWAWAG